ncbi:MAG: hypothetical protein HXX09_16465, partial [Bacteroidetes bacterium]|nr:hypothetical protein [Bacteroidota bacterium]
KITPTVETDWFNIIKNDGEPGDKAKFNIGTRENDVNVFYEIEHKGRIISKQWIALNNEQKNIEVPILESFRGNFCVHFTFVKNNRNYQHDAVISVPYSNKQLDLEFETFRNKLLPGQKEEWKIKIKNKKGDKIAAEMLAGMYDASLDAFKPNSWWLNINKTYYSQLTWDTYGAFVLNTSALAAKDWNPYSYFYGKYYDQLNWFGIPFYNNYYSYGWGGRDDYFAYDQIQSITTGSAGALMPGREMDNRQEEQSGGMKDGPNPPVSVSKIALSEQTITKGLGDVTTLNGKDGENRNAGVSGVVTRTNFNETAFFFPNLMTDENGSVIISFTIPEALTKWKFMGLAHTKDLKVGQIQKEVVTQKELMVMTSPPRFLREGDKITFTSKVSNLTEKDMVGEAKLMIFDASTMKPIDSLMNNYASTITFVAKKGQSAGLSWNLTIPDGIGAITYKVVAKSGAYSDGEEMAIPVLTNRMLVTESMPLPIRGKQTKNYNFTKLINSKSSTTLRNHKLTLEFTSNPAWYAIQALPYLMEYPYECAEQTFNRFYANSIASFIANSTPKIKAVFDNWKNFSPDALLSNLEKNQDLKSIVLEETPWVLDAKDESQRKQRIALLFDLNKMSNELDRALRKLEKFQVSNGGFPWFAGMPDDRYITQYIVCGMGHLNKLGIKSVKEDPRVWKMVKAAADYLDDRTKEDYDYIKKWYPNKLNENHLGFTQIQYLYARSYFLDVEVKGKNQEAFNYFKGQAKKYWLGNSRYMQGMIALSLNRYNEKATTAGIMKSLKENAIHSEEMGMYWNDMNAGYYWYQAPIETQALLIEAFDEVTNDQIAVEDLKVWLLKQKQTQDWKTTTATAEACYALLLKGTNFLADDELVEVSMGDIKIEPKKMDNVKVEAGTGYFKTSWSGSDIKPEMGNVKVTKNTEGVAWGAVYWQYFEQLDKITPHETPLKLEKKLFVERNTPSGPVIEPITESTKLKVGDKIKARIELRVDRNMEYIHMKDMRASGFEPVNVISQYKYQDGLGYYESTKDASTNFFFSYLNKGTYVFEYAMKVTNKGDFSNGVTTIQCMYAPEFTSHSEGIRVKVGE